MRSFIALELDNGLRQKLYDVSRKGLVEGRAVRWVRPERMHLTLKFFEDLEPSALSRVTDVMERTSEGMDPFDIEVRGLGFFPDARKPRVFWAGLIDGTGSLKVLQKRLELLLSEMGVKRENRPFLPHLTLARFKGRADRLPAPDEDLDLFFGVQRVERIVLFKSDLRPQGPLYTPLSEVFLKE